MAAGIFAILDDIAMLLDDASLVTKASIKQTMPVLGDDLAVNSEKASGFHASRELPVLWAITKGSIKNKLIILPFAFFLGSFAPWLIAPILIIGGVYLSFEGAEKIHEAVEEKIFKKTHNETKDVVTEDAKIKSAILTDFILSIEIIVIAYGSVINETFAIQMIVVSTIAILATIGVYGLVALLVRLDDIGFYLIKISKEGSLTDTIGDTLVSSLPIIVRILSIIGTIAMLVVAGSIFTHNISYIHHFQENSLHFLPDIFFDTFLALCVGYIVYFIFKITIHREK